jgi:hypothetical protein
MHVYHTLDSQPIHSICDAAMTNKNWILLDRWACESVAEVTAEAVDGSGNKTYLSDRN